MKARRTHMLHAGAPRPRCPPCCCTRSRDPRPAFLRWRACVWPPRFCTVFNPCPIAVAELITLSLPPFLLTPGLEEDIRHLGTDKCDPRATKEGWLAGGQAPQRWITARCKEWTQAQAQANARTEHGESARPRADVVVGGIPVVYHGMYVCMYVIWHIRHSVLLRVFVLAFLRDLLQR